MICAYIRELCYLLLSPAISAVLFLCSAVVLVLFERKQVGHKLRTIALGSFVLLSGGYLTFNIFDYVRYRQTGFILSPFNRFCFEMFLSPADLHLPYAMRRLTCQAESVSIRYRHRYGGLQRVEFRIVNDTPKEHPYSALTKLNLFFEGEVVCSGGVFRRFAKSLQGGVHLLPGTNSFALCDYEIPTVETLQNEYEIRLRITGDVCATIECFPKSDIAICNATSE